MLGNYDVAATLAVSDLDRAREFYEKVLGFTGQESPDGEGVLYASGSTKLFVYPSAYAGTNKATAATFNIPGDAFDSEIASLREKGIEFLTFDYEGITWDEGVATLGEERAVWFTDPDGNILAVGSWELPT